MSSIKQGKSAEQLQVQLDQTLIQMDRNQKNGNYVDAESNRIRSQELKRDLQLRQVYQMQIRHKQENNQINKAHSQQMSNFANFWDKKLADFRAQGAQLQQQMSLRHQAQLDKQREQLEKLNPMKVKQSSECLNLRKMQEHMVKQKNYVEAHKVQQRILQLQKSQKSVWLSNRQLKIQTALNTLRAKQASQLNNLQKRIKTGTEQQLKDRLHEQIRLKKKYENIQKELKMQQDKEVLAFRGHFKSKGGQGSPMGKSKFLQTGMSK